MSEHDPMQPPPGTPDDRELETFLSRKSPLSQAYREALPPERVPDNIDAAVKAWAKREHDQHLGKRGRWWDRAALPLGAAASLILVALLVNKGRESGVSESEAMREAATQEAARVEGPAKAIQGRAEPAAPATVPSAAPRDAMGRVESAGDQAAKSPRKQAVTPASPPPAMQSEPVTVASAPAPLPPPANAEADANHESQQPGPALEDRVNAPAEQKAANAPAQRAAGVMASAGTAAMKSAGVAAEAPSAPPALAAPAPSPAPFPAAPAAMKATPGPTLADQAQLQRCDSAVAGPDQVATSYPAAATWLNGIRSLRDAHQVDTAQRQLRCWKKVYPQSAVPDDLTKLIGP